MSDATPKEPVRRTKVAGSNLRGSPSEIVSLDDDGDDDADDNTGMIKETVTDKIAA